MGGMSAQSEQVTSEAVQRTRLWRFLDSLNTPQSEIEFLITDGAGKFAVAENGMVTRNEQGNIIYAALSQGGLAAAETTCRDCGYMGGCSYEGETHTPTQGCGGPYHREAAALAATGAAQGDGDTALRDAAEGFLREDDLRDLAKAILAQDGGGERD